ncbi:MAG: flagellar motor switch protein FliN [Deltaproteobacteria bacterium]|nr:flagellar motor switch protein FliN [Deltaproteobacteria bacterium]
MANENNISEGNQDQITAASVDLAEMLPDMQQENSPKNMDFLLDIPLEITVELGSTRITIGELLRLSQGSVVELNKLTDEPLEIFVNRKLMAQGEVVVVNEKFGIRLTNIISPGDRVKELS